MKRVRIGRAAVCAVAVVGVCHALAGAAEGCGFAVSEPEVFVDNQARGRSGHMGHALIDCGGGRILAFNSNVPTNRCDGHSGYGWMEYRVSRDYGRTWDAPRVLDYSMKVYREGKHTALCEKGVRAPDGRIILFFQITDASRPISCEPWSEPTYVESRDGGETWSAARAACPERGRIYDAVVDRDSVYFVMPTSPNFCDAKQEYVVYKSTNGGPFVRHATTIEGSGKGYGAMEFAPDGSLVVYAYDSRNEAHPQYCVSRDRGETWEKPRRCTCAKLIRNPQVRRIGDDWFMCGRNGNDWTTPGCGDGLVLYHSKNGIDWDAGIKVTRRPDGTGTGFYSCLLPVFEPGRPPRLLLQYSRPYRRSSVNVEHRWIELKRPAFQPLMRVGKPGEARPAGWLRDRAVAARDGFTGHMDEVDEHFRLAWTTNCMRRGKQLAWNDAHKGSWSAEGGAYWFEGLVKLAFQLDDAELKAMAKRRLDPVLDNVGPNTVGFLWWYDRRRDEDVKDAFENGEWRFWTVGISERALSAWWDATGDARVPRALGNVFGYRAMAERHGGYATMASAVVDAYRITSSPAVAETAAVCCERLAKDNRYAHYTKQPWKHLADTLNLTRRHTWHYGMPDRHGVAASESLLSVFRLAQFTGNESLRQAVFDWYAFFDSHCRQPYGVTMMDEEWGWAGVKRATETCDVAAEIYTRENILAALGDGKWGDDVERAFFNAGPACVSRDFWRHVYYQMPNRTGAKGESAKMSCPFDSHLRYSLSVWPLCCTAALNRILPNYVQYMWLKTADGGVAAALYGPSTFETDLPSGRVRFEERTAYPFDETVEIRITAAPAAAFPLKLRLPRWCERPEVSVNGAELAAVAERGFATVRRAWKAGDTVTLRLKMSPQIEDFRDMNEQGRLRRSVVLGPLLFAHAIGTSDNNTPSAPVREPILPSALKPSDLTVRRGAMPAVWDWPEASPLAIDVRDADGLPLRLVPYGCTKLRISAFGVR